MLKISPKQIKQLQNGELSQKALVDLILDSTPSTELAYAYVELLLLSGTQNERIPITEAAFNEHFRIIGKDGRGRKKKE